MKIKDFFFAGHEIMVLLFGMLAVVELQASDTAKIYAPRTAGMAPANESTVVALEDGSYKIFFINRPGDADKMMSIRSEDGMEWNQPQTEFDLPGQAYYANQVIEDRDGVLHCVFHIWGEGDNGYRNRHLDLWYTKKESSKSVWEKPKKIFEGYIGAIRNFIQLESGRLLMSFGKAVPQRQKPPHKNEMDWGWNEVMVLYSDDNGLNWKSSGDLLNIEIDSEKTTRYGAIEPDIIELENGKLWMLIRTNKGHLYESLSYNSGEKWTKPLPSIFISSDSPVDFLRLQDKRIVLFLNMNQRWDDPNSYAFGGRKVLHGAISSDDGKTWSGFREILNVTDSRKSYERGDRGTAYPSAVETKDGEIILVTGQGESRSIVLFDPDWLEEKGNIQLSGYINKKTLNDQEIVIHFPAFRKGEVSFGMDLPDQKQPMGFALTDHFSIAEDSLASENGVFVHSFDKGVNRTSIDVRMIWDIEKKYSQFFINGLKISKSGIRRASHTGINYLRVGLDSDKPDVKPFFKIFDVKVLSESM